MELTQDDIVERKIFLHGDKFSGFIGDNYFAF
jgi:hypothetical protein